MMNEGTDTSHGEGVSVAPWIHFGFCARGFILISRVPWVPTRSSRPPPTEVNKMPMF